MFIDKNKRRFNIYAACTIDKVQYPAGFFLDAIAREQAGIVEIPDPVRESEETHYVQELDEAPYLVNTPKEPEVLAREASVKAKALIEGLENGQLRAMREAVLTGDLSRLQAIEAQIVAARANIITEE